MFTLEQTKLYAFINNEIKKFDNKAKKQLQRILNKEPNTLKQLTKNQDTILHVIVTNQNFNDNSKIELIKFLLNQGCRELIPNKNQQNKTCADLTTIPQLKNLLKCMLKTPQNDVQKFNANNIEFFRGAFASGRKTLTTKKDFFTFIEHLLITEDFAYLAKFIQNSKNIFVDENGEAITLEIFPFKLYETNLYDKIKKFLAQHPNSDLSSIINDFINDALHDNNLALLKKLLSLVPDLNNLKAAEMELKREDHSNEKSIISILTSAILKDQFEIADYLLSTFPETSPQFSIALEIIIALKKQTRLEIVKKLSQNRPSLFEQPLPTKQELPIWLAIKNNHHELVKIIIETNPQMLKVTSGSLGYSILHSAVQFSNLKTLKYLLTTGLDVNTVSLHNMTPFCLAVLLGEAQKAALLIQNNANVNTPYKTLKTAQTSFRSSDDSNSLTQIMIKIGCSDEEIAQSGGNFSCPPLFIAVANNRLDLVKLLSAQPACQIDQPCLSLSPFMLAAQNNEQEICKILLQAGANINRTNYLSMSALLLALDEGHENLAIFLLENGANPNWQDDFKHWTPLLYAIYADYPNALLKLLQKGADVIGYRFNGDLKQELLAIAKELDKLNVINVLTELINIETAQKQAQQKYEKTQRKSQTKYARHVANHGLLKSNTQQAIAPNIPPLTFLTNSYITAQDIIRYAEERGQSYQIRGHNGYLWYDDGSVLAQQTDASYTEVEKLLRDYLRTATEQGDNGLKPWQSNLKTTLQFDSEENTQTIVTQFFELKGPGSWRVLVAKVPPAPIPAENLPNDARRKVWNQMSRKSLLVPLLAFNHAEKLPEIRHKIFNLTSPQVQLQPPTIAQTQQMSNTPAPPLTRMG